MKIILLISNLGCLINEWQIASILLGQNTMCTLGGERGCASRLIYVDVIGFCEGIALGFSPPKKIGIR